MTDAEALAASVSVAGDGEQPATIAALPQCCGVTSKVWVWEPVFVTVNPALCAVPAGTCTLATCGVTVTP